MADFFRLSTYTEYQCMRSTTEITIITEPI